MSRRRRRDEFRDYYDDERDRGPTGAAPPRFLPHLLILVALVGGALAAVHYFAGPRMFEKVLQELASPVGIVWLLLFVASYWSMMWRIRLLAFCCGLAWALLTVLGNSLVAGALVGLVEQQYAATNPFDLERFDAVLVLGGGSDTTPAGIPQLSSRGDRLALAARLFHAGKVDRIVVSGVRRERDPGRPEIHEESAELLRQLGVPAADIVQLKVGEDTSGEVQGLKRWLDESSATVEDPNPSADSPEGDAPAASGASSSDVSRIGLLTSAWHLRRAVKLAAKYEVAVVPIPADFLSGPIGREPNFLIPGASHLVVSHLAIRELIGYWLDQ